MLAPIWLSAALTGIAPRTRQQRSLSLALTAGYVLLSLSTCPPVRAIGLLGGMAYCIGLLIAAYCRGDRAVLLLLFPCAATVGLRGLVILPGLELPFFSESIRFYVMRCARIYDIPFTLGCMTFVCRRFALQFDRTEQLARELDQRVADRTRALTEETEARKSMMLNIFHDLRSPLFAVSSGLDTLEAAPEGAVRYIAFIPTGIGEKELEERVRALADGTCITWQESEASLYGAMLVEKNVMSLLLMSLYLVIFVQVVQNASVTSNAKRRELVSLYLMGYTKRDISLVAFLMAFFMTGFSFIIGTVLAKLFLMAIPYCVTLFAKGSLRLDVSSLPAVYAGFTLLSVVSYVRFFRSRLKEDTVREVLNSV